MSGRLNTHFDEEALSRMDNEGGASQPEAVSQEAPTVAAFMEIADRPMLLGHVKHKSSEMFEVYARLAERWNAQLSGAGTLAQGPLPAAA
jgi:hypothetical protein